MFESKINRGRAGGYAPLDGDGKVPLSKLPPIQSTIDTGSFVKVDQLGSFAITGSNVFTGTQIITGSDTNVLAIGQINFTAPNSFDIRATANSSAVLSLTSDFQSQVGAVIDPFSNASTASIFGNSLVGIPFSEDPIAYIGVQRGENSKLWLFDFSGSANFPGDINVGYVGILGETSGSLNVKNGNINVSGSVNVSSSLVVSSTVVNNGTIDALNSDLIIEGGYLILTGSAVPSELSGSNGDKQGMIVADNNNIYYCTENYVGGPAIGVDATGITTHVFDKFSSQDWNAYGQNFLQTGYSQESNGGITPLAGWYFVDDNFTIRQLIPTQFWAGSQPLMPVENGAGWLCDADGPWTYSNDNTTLTFYETEPALIYGSGPDIWKKARLDGNPNYAPMGSGSFINAFTDTTVLDVTKDIHLIDITDKNDSSSFYLPDGLYDGQVLRFALKGNGVASPNSVFIYMNALRNYTGETQASASWAPFYDNEGNGYDNPRSLATAVYIDGAWNIDSDWWFF